MNKELVYKVEVKVTEVFFADNEIEAHKIAKQVATNYNEDNYTMKQIGTAAWLSQKELAEEEAKKNKKKAPILKLVD